MAAKRGLTKAFRPSDGLKREVDTTAGEDRDIDYPAQPARQPEGEA